MNARGGPASSGPSTAFGAGIVSRSFFASLVMLSIVTSWLAGSGSTGSCGSGRPLRRNAPPTVANELGQRRPGFLARAMRTPAFRTSGGGVAVGLVRGSGRVEGRRAPSDRASRGATGGRRRHSRIHLAPSAEVRGIVALPSGHQEASQPRRARPRPRTRPVWEEWHQRTPRDCDRDRPFRYSQEAGCSNPPAPPFAWLVLRPCPHLHDGRSADGAPAGCWPAAETDGFEIHVKPLRYREKASPGRADRLPHADHHAPGPRRCLPFGEVVAFGAKRRPGRSIRVHLADRSVDVSEPRAEVLRFLYLHEWMPWYLHRDHGRGCPPRPRAIGSPCGTTARGTSPSPMRDRPCGVCRPPEPSALRRRTEANAKKEGPLTADPQGPLLLGFGWRWSRPVVEVLADERVLEPTAIQSSWTPHLHVEIGPQVSGADPELPRTRASRYRFR